MTQLNKSRPPPQAVEMQHWLLTSAGELRSLRMSLGQALAGLRATGDSELGESPERVTLVATELATNALQHGRPPTTVRLLRHNDRFLLDVADHSPDGVPLAAAASLTNLRGRGLAIAHRMSLQVGWYVTGDTKHVWASFPIATEHAFPSTR